MAILLSKNHISLSSSNETRSLCAPILAHYGIHYFYFVRMFDNGDCYLLSTHNNVVNYMLEKEHELLAPIAPHLIKQKIFYLIEACESYQHVAKDLCSFFNVAHVMNAYEQGEGYIDAFCFGSSPNNTEIINFYFNNVDIIDKFNLYFKEQAKNLFNSCKQQSIHLPHHMRLNFNSHTLSQKTEYSLPNKSLMIQNRQVFLTQREIDCLNKLMLGYSAKETGKLLKLSYRTVEYYLQNAKSKMGCSKKSEVLYILRNQFL